MSAAGFDVRAYSLDAQGSLRTRLSGVGEPLDDALPRPAPLPPRAVRRHDHVAQSRARHPDPQGRAHHRVPQHLGVRAALDGGCAARARRRRARGAGATRPDRRHARAARPAARGRRGQRARPCAQRRAHDRARSIDGELLDALLQRAVALAPEAVAHDLEHLREVLARQQAVLHRDRSRPPRGVRPGAAPHPRPRPRARAWPIGAELDPAGTARALDPDRRRPRLGRPSGRPHRGAAGAGGPRRHAADGGQSRCPCAPNTSSTRGGARPARGFHREQEGVGARSAARHHMAFDIDTFASASVKVGWDDLDLDAFRRDPLPEGTLRTLRYMCDVEYHTVCYLRDMLVTPVAHRLRRLDVHDDVEPRGVLARRGARRRPRRARHHRRVRPGEGQPDEARVEGPPRPDQAVAARQHRRQGLHRGAHVVGRRQRAQRRRRLQAPRRAREAPRAHPAAEAHRRAGEPAHRLLRDPGAQAPRGERARPAP